MAKTSTKKTSSTTATATTGQVRPQPTSAASVENFVPVVGSPRVCVDFPSSEQIRVPARDGDGKPYRYEVAEIQLPTVGQIVWRLNRSTWSDQPRLLPGTVDEAGNLIEGIKPPQPYRVLAVNTTDGARRVDVVLIGPPVDESPQPSSPSPTPGTKEPMSDGISTDPDPNASSGS